MPHIVSHKIKDMFDRIFYSNWLFWVSTIFISGLLIYFLNKALIDLYIWNPFIGGWDGSSHFAAAKYYSDNIFPSIWGWIPTWYMGMPFPLFYPPLFYYLNAIIDSIINIPFEYIFKFTVFFSIVTIPPLLSFFYYSVVKKSKIQSLLVLITSTILLSAKTNLGFVGVSVSSVLNTGLVTQPIALVFFILWLLFFIKINKNSKNKYFAGLFLSLLLLSNAHVIVVTLLVFIIIFIINLIDSFKNHRKNFLKLITLYFLSGFIPILITSLWYLPMFYFYDFFSGISIRPEDTLGNIKELFVDHYYFPLFIIISLIFSIKNKNIAIFAISIISVILGIFLFIDIDNILPSFPFHPDRWIGTIYVLLPILIIYSIIEIYDLIKPSYKKYFIYLLLFVVILTALHTTSKGVFRDNSRGIYINNVSEDLNIVLDYFKEKEKSAIIVESHSPNETPADLILDSLLGLQGHKLFYFILRESSSSAAVMNGIRNTFSKNPECWHSIKCHMAHDYEYRISDIDGHIENADYFGTDYFLIRSMEVKEKMNDSKLVKIEKDFGNWVLYKKIEKSDDVFVPQRYPILVFSKLNINAWSDVFFDYTSLVEQVNIKRFRFDFTFSYADENKLDKNKDLEKFKYILIQEYQYENLQETFDKLIEYSKNSKIIAIKTDAELFTMLENESVKNKNILTISNIPSKDGTDIYNDLISKLDKFVEKIKLDKIKIAKNYSDNVLSVKIDGTENNKEIPIIIKQSYFPAWKEINDQKIYLGSPTYNLIFTTGSTTIYFDTPKIVYYGHIISIIGLIITTITAVFEFRKYKK